MGVCVGGGGGGGGGVFSPDRTDVQALKYLS